MTCLILLAGCGVEEGPTPPEPPRIPAGLAWEGAAVGTLVRWRRIWWSEKDGRRVGGDGILWVRLAEDGTLEGSAEAVERARARWMLPDLPNAEVEPGTERPDLIVAGSELIDGRRREGGFAYLVCGGPPSRGVYRIWTRSGLGLPGDLLRWETSEPERTRSFRAFRNGDGWTAELTVEAGPASSRISAELDALPGRVRSLVERWEDGSAKSELRLDRLD